MQLKPGVVQAPMLVSHTERLVQSPEAGEPNEHGAMQRRARVIQGAIGDLLLKEWDPIGIADVPEAQDEYDSYVGRVYRVLASGASPQAVAEFLWAIEKDMGLKRSGLDELLPVAEKLCGLDIRLSQE